MGAGASTSSTPTDPNGIQPGFGFQPGQLIPPAPLIFPGEQDLFMLLELTAEYAGYFGYIGQIIAVIAEVILVILELIDELVSLFTGKPRAQDTLTVAKRLGRGQSPVAHLMSVQISRNLDQNNIVLSSSLGSRSADTRRYSQAGAAHARANGYAGGSRETGSR